MGAYIFNFAVVAQSVERNFPKVKVAGSTPVYRSKASYVGSDAQVGPDVLAAHQKALVT